MWEISTKPCVKSYRCKWSLEGAVADIILKIKTSPAHEADFLAWQPEKGGVFTVRSAYKLGLSLMLQERGYVSSSSAPVDIWRVIWRSNVPEKVSIFAWWAIQKFLATEMNKRKRNMHVTRLCTICAMEEENGAHIFF
jgi:hypothetical protein